MYWFLSPIDTDLRKSDWITMKWEGVFERHWVSAQHLLIRLGIDWRWPHSWCSPWSKAVCPTSSPSPAADTWVCPAPLPSSPCPPWSCLALMLSWHWPRPARSPPSTQDGTGIGIWLDSQSLPRDFDLLGNRLTFYLCSQASEASDAKTNTSSRAKRWRTSGPDAVVWTLTPTWSGLSP